MFSRIFLSGILSLAGLAACEPKTLENTKEIAAEAEQHKIKRITTPMIGQEAQRVGDSLVILAYKSLRPGRQEQPASCRLQDYEPVANLTSLYMATAGYALANNPAGYKRFMAELQTWKKGLPVRDPERSEAEVYMTGDSVFYAMPITPEVADLVACFKTDPANKSNATAGYWYVRFDKSGLIQAITRKVKKGRWGRKKEADE